MSQSFLQALCIIKKSRPVEKVIDSTNFTVLSLLFHNFDSNSYYKLALSCIFLTSIDLHCILCFNKFFTICSSSTGQNNKYAKFILILISNLRNFLPVSSTGQNTKYAKSNILKEKYKIRLTLRLTQYLQQNQVKTRPLGGMNIIYKLF